jgi:hypothetical protein
MSITPLLTPTKKRRIVTRARCVVCGAPVTAESKLEAVMMNSFPKDGEWRCERCRGRR